MYAEIPEALTVKLLIAVLLVASGVTSALMFHFKIELDRVVTAREERTKHQLALVGSTRLWSGSNGEFFNYHLRSFDGGASWVAINMADDGRMKILGDAEALYPGLLAAIQHGHDLAELVTTIGSKG